MPKKTVIPYLRLMPKSATKRGVGVQMPLFVFNYPPSLMGFLNTSSVTVGFLLSLIEKVMPRWVFDLRAVPRFNFGGGNRKMVFERFMQHRVEYRDLTAILRISSRRDASLNSERVTDAIGVILEDSVDKCLIGPLLFLLDDAGAQASFIKQLPKSLERPKGGWEVRVFDIDIEALAT